MKTFGSIVFVLALSLANSLSLAGEGKLEIATSEWPPYYGKGLENNVFLTEIILEAFKPAGMNVQPLDTSELGSITTAHWVIVNRNKPTNEIVLDEPPHGV